MLWAFEQNKAETNTPNEDDLKVYLKGNKLPICPTGGACIIGAVNVRTRCSMHSDEPELSMSDAILTACPIVIGMLCLVCIVLITSRNQFRVHRCFMNREAINNELELSRSDAVPTAGQANVPAGAVPGGAGLETNVPSNVPLNH